MRSNRALPIDEQVKKHLKRGKLKAQQGEHAAAVQEFDALLVLKPTHANARFLKAQSHLMLNQLAEAIVTFEEVLKSSDSLRAKAKDQLAKIFESHRNITAEEIDTLSANPSHLLRDAMLRPEYTQGLNELIQLHQNISVLDFKQQVPAVINLINFCEKYYTRQNGKYGYIKPELYDPAKPGQLARLQVIGNVIAKATLFNIINDKKLQAHSFSEILEVDCLTTLRLVENDLYLNDAMRVLQMLFQSIHQLDREKRGELYKRMPWGTNSWYHLDFCSTFFRNQHVHVTVKFSGDLSRDEIQSILEFQQSMVYERALVKAVIPALLTTDLPAIRSFFAVVQDPKPENDAIVMQDLPNLHKLLWHFKHSYQLIKLLAVLPDKVREHTNFIVEGDKKTGIAKTPTLILTPMVQLLVTNYEDNFTQVLKEKLSILRRMQMLAEVFSRRNWGSQLDDIDILDPDIIGMIRNGLCHPDELTSSKVIEEIESSSQTLTNLHLDLIRFRDEIYRLIVQRQKNFPRLIGIDKLDERGQALVIQDYWHAIQRLYQPTEDVNGDDYCTHSPLLSPDDMHLAGQLLPGCRFSEKILAMLNGVIPFVCQNKKSGFDPERDKYPINKIHGVKLEGDAKRTNDENKNAVAAINKLLAKANKSYEDSKRVYLQVTKAEKDKLKAIRSGRLEEFPTDDMNSEDYRPHYPLLLPEDMREAAKLLQGCRSSDRILDMLNGNTPYAKPDEADFDDKYHFNRVRGVRLNGDAKSIDSKNKKEVEKIDKLLEKANRFYAESKRTYLETTKTGANKLKTIRRGRLKEFPTVMKLAEDFTASFKNEDKGIPPMCQEALIKFLQQRVKLLHQLIMEVPSYAAGNTRSDELISHVSKDVNLLHALTYLTTQTISILNALHSKQALAVICPALPARLEDYIQLRNALEHTDPVIDSLEDAYIQMNSKSNVYLCKIALELVITYYDALSQTSPDTLSKLQALEQALDKADKSEKAGKPDKVQQRKAMTLSAAGNPGLFERLIVTELPSPAEAAQKSNDKKDKPKI